VSFISSKHEHHSGEFAYTSSSKIGMSEYKVLNFLLLIFSMQNVIINRPQFGLIIYENYMENAKFITQ
jgi:hypothetical protein